MGKLNANELNLFISLVQQSYQKGTRTLVYDFDKLKALSKYDRSNERFVKDIMRTNSKLLSINAYIDDGVTIKQFACFNTFEINRAKQTLKVAVNPDFQGLFKYSGVLEFLFTFECSIYPLTNSLPPEQATTLMKRLLISVK